jgi:hypothetical protein
MEQYTAFEIHRFFLLPRRLILAALCLWVPSHSKPLYNGASINGLNGYNAGAASGLDNEKICYVLDHLNDMTTNVPDQLNNTFTTYQKAGINLIRIPIHPGADDGCNHNLVYILKSGVSQPYYPNEYAEDLYNGGGSWSDWWGDHMTHNYWPYASNADIVNANRQARANRIATVNSFITKAASYGIKVEIQFQTVAMIPNTVDYGDIVPLTSLACPVACKYANDKAWIDAWMKDLDLTNVVLVTLNFEAMIQSAGLQADGKTHWYYPDPNFPTADGFYSRAQSHGKYLLDIWPWFHGKYPTVPATFEFWTEGYNTAYLIDGMQYSADPGLVTGVANWIGANLPGLTYAGIETYFYLPVATASRSDYLTTAKQLLAAYFSSNYYQTTHTPLWIDEYGHLICTTPGVNCPATETHQDNYYYGMLNASEQYSGDQIAGRVSWVGTNDQPYNGVRYFGLISSYDNDSHGKPVVPVVRPAWNNVTSFYLGNPLVVPTSISTILLNQ